MSTIARYYDQAKNAGGGYLPGVPLGDIDQETFDALPAWLQDSIDASPFYRKTRPPTTKAKADEATPKAWPPSAQAKADARAAAPEPTEPSKPATKPDKE